MSARPMLRLKLLAVARYMLFGLSIGLALGYVEYLTIGDQFRVTMLWGLIAGVMIGATVGVVEVFVFFGRLRNAPFFGLLALRLVVYLATFVLWLSLANAARIAEAQGFGFADSVRFYVLVEGNFPRDFTAVTIASVLFLWILQVGQLHRGRDVFNFILGRYHRPQEIEHAFLFLDLTASTSVAERLGHLKWSAFLKDFFFDVNIAVLPWRGEIYQYVGDEVIVTWPMKTAAERAGCVACFFEIIDVVERNRDRYLRHYGVSPEFKGGLHGGKVVVTWVGEIKKEIVYHGDVLNTTARIQVEAKAAPHACLVSGDLLARLSLPDSIAATAVGEVTLRGKERPLVLYGLDRSPR